MHKSATKCNETLGKWCKNKHGASKIIDTFETYQDVNDLVCLDTQQSQHVGHNKKIIVVEDGDCFLT
jgi:hypothetical protein